MKQVVMKIALMSAAFILTASCLFSCSLPESLSEYNYSTEAPAETEAMSAEEVEDGLISDIRGNKISEEITEKFKYTVYSNGIQIDGVCDESTQTVEIPEEISGKDVIGIGKRAFYGCKELKSIVLPSSIKYIDCSAFAYCTSLELAELPEGVAHIGSRAFNYCESLTKMVFPDSIEYVGEYVLALSSVSETDIPPQLTSIPCGLYYGTEISDVNIPGHITKIEKNAFACCDNIETVIIPGHVAEIEELAFSYNQGLKTVLIEEGLASLEYAVFGGCKNLESVTVPKSVENVNGGVFSESADDIVIYGEADSKIEEFAANGDYEFIVNE